jgi:hypothetical protein
MYKKLQSLSFFAAKVFFVVSFLGFTMKASANIDSGGGVSSIGTKINHSSVGSPFATGPKTAGLIDILYPITPESAPAGSGGGNAGGGGGAPAGGGGPSEKPSSKKNKGSGGGSEKKKGSKSSDAKSAKVSASKNKEKKSGSQNSVRTKKKTK